MKTKLCAIGVIVLGNAFADMAPPELVQVNIDGTVNGRRPTFFSECSNQFYVDVDFLYLHGDLDGFTYALTTDPVTYSNTFSRSGPQNNGVLHDVDFEWGPGCRITLGDHFLNDQWAFAASFTYFNKTSSDHINVNLADTFIHASEIPLPFFPGIYICDHAHASWTLDVKLIDLELGRTAFATRSITASPFICLRGALLHQKFKAEYSGNGFFAARNSVALTPSGTISGPFTYVGTNNYNALGFRPGINMNWYLSKDWSFYTNASGSLFIGQFKTKQTIDSTGTVTRNWLQDHLKFFQVTAAFDVAVGLQWETFFQQNRHLALSLGYEMMEWLQQNQIFKFFGIDNVSGKGNPMRGDLGLQGINASARFDF